MIEKIKKLFLTDPKYTGAVLFGSQLNSPKPDSDTDIVLFTADSNFVHKIYKLEGDLFDVFEMSLEQAFEFLRLRHPLWLSAFSTALNITDCESVDLIIETAVQIVSKYNLLLNNSDLSKLAFSLEACYKKCCVNRDNYFIYTHCAEEFMRSVKRALFCINNIKPCPYDQQVMVLVSEFGVVSELIQHFLLENKLPEKHQIATNIYNHTRSLLPTISYPITL
ncbi:putative nucleotidyltransferase [Rheinheimera pacifica]|uniref:hypothetical protein n=1 Tax=Rheinheimera pacifica TaxID=173990 RepID=UPI002861B9FD|nr:hypothetical protein [Rheinheimera pacifica]MDR6983957.1 putative nucleotidyltransferase [Rheinheimera pacifica]